MNPARISFIATVLNEGKSIIRLLESLLAQTRRPDEVIIVDGGSKDETVTHIRAYAERLNIQLIIEVGANISRGRNLAIQHATGEILAISDAGVRLPNDWLEHLCAPLLQNPSLTVSAGFFYADPHSVFEAALGATTLPLVHEIHADSFLPSSRSVAVRRSAAQTIGGYPEWLDYCEDLIFDLRLQAHYAPFAFVPQAAVHFQPRPHLRAFFKQYYLYARGDGKADLWRKRHIIRYLTYGVGAPILLGFSLFVHPLFWGVLLAGFSAYLATPYRRLAAVMRRLPFSPSWLDWLKAGLWIPLIRVTGDIAKMLGYPVGLNWRRHNHPPEWRENSLQ